MNSLQASKEWLVVFLIGLFLEPADYANGQACIEIQQDSADTASWPVTWVPGCTPELKFSVQMVNTDGVARILLAKDKTPSTPYFVMNLGWSDRVENCNAALGMKDESISDGQISASTMHADGPIEDARLDGTGAWCGSTAALPQWIQVNLQTRHYVSGIISQGRSNAAQWVTKYKVEYGDDGTTWQYVDNEMEFTANTDQNTKMTNMFANPVLTTYIRINPTDYGGTSPAGGWPCMRFELLGCQAPSVMTGPFSYLGLCTASETDGDCVSDIDADKEAFVLNNGDVSETGPTTFVLSIDENGVNVGYENQEPFLSLDVDESEFDVEDIRFVGVQSHDGVDGSFDHSSTWQFCTDDWQSLASGRTVTGNFCVAGACSVVVDGDPSTCYDSGGEDNPFIEIDLGQEMHVVGVTFYDDTAISNLVATTVYVGSCSTAADNIQCGTDGVDSYPTFRACPTNTYGQYITILMIGSSVNLEICEVIVHGKEIAEADKVMFEFASSSYSTNEQPGSDGTGTHSQAVTITRSRSTGSRTLTCNEIDIADITSAGGGTATADDYTFTDVSPIEFTVPGVESIAITEDMNLVRYLADCVQEDDETIILELVNPTNGAIVGTKSTTTITVFDDDPLYKFSSTTKSVEENDPSGKVTFTIERTAFTSILTTIHVNTIDCGDGKRADANVDYTSLTSKAVSFPPTITSQTVDIYITNDDGNIDDEDETFCVALDKSVSNRGEISMSPVTVTIYNDDTVYSFCETEFSGVEGTEEIMVRICRTGKTDTPGCIDVYLEPASAPRAIEGENYDYPSFPRTPITFAGNEESKTISVPINNDDLVEEMERFQIILGLPVTSCSSDVSPVVDNSGMSNARLDIVDDDTAYRVLQTVNQVLEDKESVTVRFERGDIITREGVITVRVSGGTNSEPNVGTATATEGIDFEMEGEHEVIFEVGEITAEITIPIIDDPLIELNEEFYVEIISGDSEINQGRKQTEVVILNNDAFFSIRETERTVLESISSFHVVVQRGPMEVNGVYIAPYLEDDVTITLNTNTNQALGATEGSDFVGISKMIKFSGATRDVVKTCPIEIINDQEIEEEEAFLVTISNENVQIDSGRNQSKITVFDDDGRITCSVDGETTVSIDEGQRNLTITCTRNGLTNNDGSDQSSNRVAVFTLTASPETARQGYDFTSYSSTLRFPTDVNTITETIDLIIDDLELEDPETFRLEITASDSDTTSNFVTVTILDNDVQGFQFEESTYIVGESCGELEVTVIRTGSGILQQGTTLKITASDGTGNNAARYPDDYKTQEALITFLGNQRRQVVTFKINNDGDNEEPETFTLTLTKLSGFGEVTQSVATVTIQEQTVTYSAQNSEVTVTEVSGLQPLYFVRRGDFCRAAEIYISTRDGSAESGIDYVGFTGRRVSFGTNSDTAVVDVAILDDRREERDETFIVEIQGSNTQIGNGITTVTIQDNDGQVRFSQSEYTTPEGSGSVSLTIEVDSDITPTTVEVETVIGSGTAIAGNDYTIVSNRLIDFNAGETSKTFSVPILDDGDEEIDETFVVVIVNVSPGGIGDPREAIVTILDDDKPSGSGLSSSAIIGIAGGVGGGALLLIVIGIILALSALGTGPGTAAASAARGRPTPYYLNRTANYQQNYGYQRNAIPQQGSVYYR